MRLLRSIYFCDEIPASEIQKSLDGIQLDEKNMLYIITRPYIELPRVM